MARRHLITPVLFCLLTLIAVCVGVAATAFARRSSTPRSYSETPLQADDDPKQNDDGLAKGLAASEKELLWDIEHHGNLLNKFGFKPVSDALSRADEQGALEAFAADFSGRVPAASQTLEVVRDFVQVSRARAQDTEYVPLDRAAFVARLLAYRQRFAQPPKVEMKLIKLAPENRKDFQGPWNGSCALRLAGDLSPGQPGEVSLQFTFHIKQPTEDNLKKGGWLQAATITESLIGQASHYLMRDATAERGINAGLFLDNWYAPPEQRQPNSGGVFLCDFDRDGILDMLIVDVKRFVLYKGLPGGKFRDVTSAVGLPEKPPPDGVSMVAAFVDVDGDGWEDLFLAGRFYRNDGGKRFVDVTERTNLRLRPGCTGLAVADYDRDGRLDLYVCYGGQPKGSSWIDGTAAESPGNQLWRNKGDWKFEDVTQAAGAAGGSRSTFTALWFDANNDGWPDLHVINEFGPGVLLINQGDGTFREQLLAKGPNDFGSMGATVGDIDNDGNMDLYIANMYSKAGTRVIGNVCPGTYPEPIMATMRQFVAGSQLWHNKGNLEFEPLGKEYGIASVGWAWGAALVDLDNDGWLDLYATAGFVSQSRSDPDG